MEYGMHRRQFNLFPPLTALFVAITTFFLAQPSAAAEKTGDSPPKYILAIGDSLTAGYMLGPDESFPVQLEAHLRASGENVRVINAGVSGDTSKGGLSRLDWALGDIPGGAPHVVVLELGANDAMRGIEPASVRENLSAIIEHLQKTGTHILLAGMLAPPNMGPAYAAEFDPIYAALATKYNLTLYPFFLDGVATHTELTLADGKHPTAEGVSIIVTRIAPLVTKLLME
jgi:acyl-CoA thioesterase I